MTKASSVCVEGYGILQPRVAASLPGTNRSRYARLCGSEPGIDPYTRSVSDVYQDLFGEGSFIGKGIYDVDAFEQALNAVSREPHPESRSARRLLCAIGADERRAALRGVSCSLQRGHAPPPSLDSRRLADRALAAAGACPERSARRRERIRCPALSRWKIFDNLRRSLVPPALTLLLLLGWTVLSPPGSGRWR